MLRGTQKIGNSKWAVICYDELFVTLNSINNGPAAGIDRNRLFFGINRILSRSRSIEAGYRIEYINKTDVDNESRRQLILQLNSTF